MIDRESNLLLYSSYSSTSSYPQSLHQQSLALKQVKEDHSKAYALFYDYPEPNITMGLRGQRSDILISDNELFIKKYKTHSIKRGGVTTLHSPGQLVFYPLFSLKKINLGVKDYIDWLLKVTQTALKKLHIHSSLSQDNPGLYTKKGKIAFIGMSFSQGVSYHGLSINVNNDLSLFKDIIPCGQLEICFDKVENYNSSLSTAYLQQIIQSELTTELKKSFQVSHFNTKL